VEFVSQKSGSVLVVQLNGERLDANSSRLLKDYVQSHIASGLDKIVLDFEPVRFLDSSGLGVLVSLMKLLRAPGGLVMCQVNDRTIQDILRLTRMDQVFTITETVSQAIDLLEQ
jgi:anti-sigma B factor antagonist